MRPFGVFYLDREKDIIVELFMDSAEELHYVLRTPNHGTGNLISNLAKLCGLALSRDDDGRWIIRGDVPCYIDGENRTVYVFRLANTKVANIYPDGQIERKAQIPSIAKTLMSQTKDYRLGAHETIVKTYIPRDVKFRTDLHTHMNANLSPDILIALGIMHEIRYPLYYIKKLGLVLTEAQEDALMRQRRTVAAQFEDSSLTGKYLTRRIDDNTFINFADLMLSDPENAAGNIAKIRSSLAVMKDGQAVFTNLEKVYLYRYVFTKGVPAAERYLISDEKLLAIPDPDIRACAVQILADRSGGTYRNNTLFQDKLLWIARSLRAQGVVYTEISDTTLVKAEEAPAHLREIHAVMPAIYEETGVVIRFLAAIRRIPLTIVKDQVHVDYFAENLAVLRAVAADPYVAGSDIVGEEINDVRELSSVIARICAIAAETDGFVVRIHAGENDSLRDNVANSISCVRAGLAKGQKMPFLRIGHGLYTANLRSAKGRALIEELREAHAVLEFQITSNVRLNNLSAMENHPLRQYLKGGILCVQGTDGGALYGTNSIDEQLALERMLGLTMEEMAKMRAAEDTVLAKSLAAFAEKQKKWPAPADTEAFYREKIRESAGMPIALGDSGKISAEEALRDVMAPFPETGIPVVVAGGSFNSDRHATRLRAEETALIDRIIENADPEKTFFVIGHRLTGYEGYLLKKCRGRFAVYAIVPNVITPKTAEALKKSGVRICVSIEPVEMGLYKSFAYEIFKRRKSVLLAFDGNSACANMIQEARNGRHKPVIFVSGHSRVLRTKAGSLKGYVRILGADNTEEAAESILSLCGRV